MPCPVSFIYRFDAGKKLKQDPIFVIIFLTFSSFLQAPFPHGKTVVYKYYGDAKAGIIEPAPYASQFALEGDLHVKHDNSDPTLKNAYYVALLNVKTGMHNGVAAHYQRTKVLKPIVDAAKAIEKPFLIVYGDDGKVSVVTAPYSGRSDKLVSETSSS